MRGKRAEGAGCRARLNVRAAAVWDPRDNVGMKMKIGLGSEKHFSFSATLHSGLCVCFQLGSQC